MLETLKRETQDQDIRGQFSNGIYRTPGTQFRLREWQIRNIVNGSGS